MEMKRKDSDVESYSYSIFFLDLALIQSSKMETVFFVFCTENYTTILEYFWITQNMME